MNSGLIASTILWLEEFNEPDGSTSGFATGMSQSGWDTINDSRKGIFEVSNGEFLVRNTDGKSELTTRSIVIFPQFEEVTISLDVRSSGNLEDPQDFVILEYRRGQQLTESGFGPWELIGSVYGNIDGTETIIGDIDRDGNALIELRVSASTSVKRETYFLDNLKVVGNSN